MPGIKVKLVRSANGRSADQLATLAGMGLYKMGQERILPDTKATLGMCEKLCHMVEWKRVEESPTKRPARRGKKPAEQAQS